MSVRRTGWNAPRVLCLLSASVCTVACKEAPVENSGAGATAMPFEPLDDERSEGAATDARAPDEAKRDAAMVGA